MRRTNPYRTRAPNCTGNFLGFLPALFALVFQNLSRSNSGMDIETSLMIQAVEPRLEDDELLGKILIADVSGKANMARKDSSAMLLHRLEMVLPPRDSSLIEEIARIAS